MFGEMRYCGPGRLVMVHTGVKLILLKEFVVDYGPTPFRFFHSLLDCEGFFDLVVDTWKAFDSGESNGIISFRKKLQNLKQVIRAWSVATRDDLNCRISSMKILSDIDRKEASDIAQKAKVKWAIEGDENTSFFHSSLKKKRRQCAIKGILHNGVWIDDPGEVKSEFYNHFCNRFSCTDDTRPTVGDVPFNQISVEQCEFLERDVSNEEIKKAVWDCGGDRAPVDFEKAFDSLRWDYFDAIMEQLGFGNKWRMWIAGCLKNSRASILVNGSPTSEFELSKGLRQGDPMSPFLFILAMEGLHAMVSKAVNTGLFKGASIGHGSINVSHLLYADDAIFVGEWSHSNAYNLICLLRCFYMVSGLKINVHKSKLLGVNVSDEEVSNMAFVLGCGITKLPTMYLGVPVGCNMGRCDYWKRIVQKFESKMSRWKAKLLSVGGRLSIIKAVLASKAMGGLGIGSIFALNAALLFKWVWRFRTCSNGLWVNVIKGIHGIDGGIGSSRAGISTHSPWNCIVQLVSKLQAKDIDLLALCARSVGDGHSISFFEKSWCGGRSLKEKFPRVYALEVNKSCTVSQRINIEDWPSMLRRSPRGGAESNQLDELLELRLDKLPTLANMDKKGIDVASLLYPVCNAHVENVDHLFFSCGMAQDLWGLLVRWCTLDISDVSNIVEWFSWLDAACDNR
ncbi:RNA-directed DNA polymerase, eukaryota [Tanacetum coccineum]